MRIASSLICAVLASVLGLVQPIAWYLISSALFPGVFGHEYQLLLPTIAGAVGMIGGCIVGLIAGAIAPDRAGMAVSFLGLGIVHIATGLYFIPSSDDSVFAFGSILVPSAVIAFVLAAVFWFIRRKDVRS